MLVIRLSRVGKRNQPAFRLVLTEKQNPVKGKFQEILGSYNPRLKTKSLKGERIKYWLSKGAQLSATVHNLLVNEGILTAKKVKAWRPKVGSADSKKKALAEKSAAAPEKKEQAENKTAPVAEQKEEKVEEKKEEPVAA